MRRQFTPSFDGLCERISPSTLVAANDTNMPETGTSSPKIIQPLPSAPPKTIVCVVSLPQPPQPDDPLPDPEPDPGPYPGDDAPIQYPVLPPSGPIGPGK
jgi:hypothetical protein